MGDHLSGDRVGQIAVSLIPEIFYVKSSVCLDWNGL